MVSGGWPASYTIHMYVLCITHTVCCLPATMIGNKWSGTPAKEKMKMIKHERWVVFRTVRDITIRIDNIEQPNPERQALSGISTSRQRHQLYLCGWTFQEDQLWYCVYCDLLHPHNTCCPSLLHSNDTPSQEGMSWPTEIAISSIIISSCS